MGTAGGDSSGPISFDELSLNGEVRVEVEVFGRLGRGANDVVEALMLRRGGIELFFC